MPIRAGLSCAPRQIAVPRPGRRGRAQVLGVRGGRTLVQRAVRAAVLYTQTPQLIEIPLDVLAEHKPGLQEAVETYWPGTVE